MSLDSGGGMCHDSVAGSYMLHDDALYSVINIEVVRWMGTQCV